MPSFKSAVIFCVLLLLTLVFHESANAQSEESKIEVGAQISATGSNRIGGGVRLTFDLTRNLALEGELNYFPSTGFNNARSFQGQFGVKSGMRFDRIGVFGKVRPGFISAKHDGTFCLPVPCPPGSLCIQSCSPINVAGAGFSLDVGGVVELYPSKRITVRFDVGDTIVNRQEPPIFFINDRTVNLQEHPIPSASLFEVPHRRVATHNLQLGAGVGFRF